MAAERGTARLQEHGWRSSVRSLGLVAQDGPYAGRAVVTPVRVLGQRPASSVRWEASSVHTCLST
jgi:hypothetical protein